MPRQYLFVNHDGSNALSSEERSSEKAQILSHVQSRRHQRVKWANYTSTMRMVETAGPRDDGPAPRAPSSRLVVRRRKDEEERKDQQQQVRLPLEFPSNNSYDPFHSTAARTDAGNHHLLHTAITVVARPNFLAEAFAPPSACNTSQLSRHDAILSQRVRESVHDETLMYSTLAYGSCFLSWTMNVNDSGRSPEHFLDQAMTSLRKKLAGPGLVIDVWLLFSIYSLSLTQLCHGIPMLWIADKDRHKRALALQSETLVASDTHLRALLRFVEQAGGWDCFDHALLDGVLILDKFLALTKIQPPIVPLTWDPGDYPLEKCQSLAGAMRFDDEGLPGSGLIAVTASQELRKHIADAASYIHIAPLLWAQDSMDKADELWAFRRHQAILHRITALLFTNISATDRCIALSVLTFMFYSVQSSGPQSAARQLAAQLRPLLESDHVASILENEAMLWCCYVSAMIPDSFVERRWYLDQIMLREPEEWTEADRVAFFERFLYVRGLTERGLRQVHNEVQQVRSAKRSQCV